MTTQPLRIAWGPIASEGAPYGYGTIGGELKRALVGAGAAMVPLTATNWDVTVGMGWPAAWIVGQNGPRRDLVWHTMFEATPFPPGWAQVINRSAGLWAPSQWVADRFVEAGVTVPVMVSGYGIDTKVFSPPAEDRANRDGPFKVIAWARGLVSRKNLLMAVKAFCAADLGDAVLEVKVNLDDEMTTDGMGVKGRDDVRFIKQDWTSHKLAGWLAGADVMLYLSSGEGFGLMPLEAMACGTPVICAANTGMLEYLTPSNSLMVPCPTMAPVESLGMSTGEARMGYQPDFDAAVAHLRWAYDHRIELGDIGKTASQDAATWTWDRAGQSALAGLRRISTNWRGETWAA